MVVAAVVVVVAVVIFVAVLVASGPSLAQSKQSLGKGDLCCKMVGCWS